MWTPVQQGSNVKNISVGWLNIDLYQQPCPLNFALCTGLFTNLVGVRVSAKSQSGVSTSLTCSTMEASTSQPASSPESTAKIALRQRPQIHIASHGPPSRPAFVQFYHPANGLPFLTLPAYDCSPNFGIHYGTAIAACQILACNKNGYLSTSRNRDATGRINVDLDSIIPSGKYYYHLISSKSNALYPICCDFSYWEFPHKNSPRPGRTSSPIQHLSIGLQIGRR
jgi:hypothetical protein